VADPTLYLFDGHNLLHAGSFSAPRELVDLLASFVALRGARGVVVFDGAGEDASYGPLEVRHASNADALLERLAAEHREAEQICLVSSDFALRGTTGQEVASVSSARFLADLEPAETSPERPQRVADRLDDETRKRLEELRRGRGSG
jgi:predicted RNA-binding protein with PIN domain